jgi:hypothetical protein
MKEVRLLLSRHTSRTLVALTLGLGVAVTASPALAGGVPSGERIVGNAAEGHGGVIEPAYDYNTGNLTYLLTPTGAPFPSKADSHAVAPLYLIVYPSTSLNLGPFNCMGVPGNCPDHDGLIAGAATAIMPSVYGANPANVPGHDHLVGAANTGGDFNVAWHVYVELFTSTAAVTHITTLTALQNAWSSGAILTGISFPLTDQGVDSGITFNCNIVPAQTYNRGTPV